MYNENKLIRCTEAKLESVSGRGAKIAAAINVIVSEWGSTYRKQVSLGK